VPVAHRVPHDASVKQYCTSGVALQHPSNGAPGRFGDWPIYRLVLPALGTQQLGTRTKQAHTRHMYGLGHSGDCRDSNAAFNV
jgi:hypothetical protein